MLNKINSEINNFSKLYGINIPVESFSAYYIGQLLKSKEYINLPIKIQAFNELVLQLQSSEIKFNDFKMKLLYKIVERLKELGVEKTLNEYDLKNHNFNQQNFNCEPGFYYVSIDQNEANWNVYKHFGGLKSNLNWSEWLKEEFSAPEAICLSKIFRQIVFGNLNPKRVSKLQEKVTNQNLLQAKEAYNEGKHSGVVGISHDEIVIKFTKEQLNLKNPISFLKSELPVKKRIFTQEKIVQLDTEVTVESVYNDELGLKYKTLKSVPGNQFWMYFNTLILNEKRDPYERDLLFVNDGKTAKWVI